MKMKYFHRVITNYNFICVSFFLMLAVGLSTGEHCSSDGECQPAKTFRACRYGVCQCKNLVSHFDEKARMCTTHVGGSCTITKGSEQCVENAICHVSGKSSSGKCECQKGHPKTPEGLCLNGVPRIQLNQPVFFSLILFSTFGLINYASTS